MPICPKRRSKCIKYVLIVYLYCQYKWKLPGCGFNWKWNPSLTVQIYYSSTSPSGFHPGDKSFWWWMKQYLYIILQSKQGDFQFKSTIGYRYTLVMKKWFWKKDYIHINTQNNFLSCDFCVNCTGQSIPFNSGSQTQNITPKICCPL